MDTVALKNMQCRRSCVCQTPRYRWFTSWI